MPVPNDSGKYDAPSILTPDGMLSDAQASGAPLLEDAPDGVLVCYQSHFFDHVLDVRETEPLHGESDLLEFELHRFTGLDADADVDTDAELAVLGHFGIGSPTTAILMELLQSAGTEAFLSVGWSGCLQPDVPQSHYLVVDEAIRDEGVSHHYLPHSERIDASGAMVAELEHAVEAAGGKFEVGATWTTDALFRETVPEIERYAEDGVLAVDMEAAATFAVGDYRGLDVGSLFLISDYLTTDDWDRAFGESPDVVDALPVAMEALAGVLGR
ncbi:nucleoside phosphorylase [Haladaptatus sp. W1]|uniref:nucleoside phosphorylase n=1 Tax=Haladaptatus sp. W1 TaxID=1897478 RepID=UPI000AED4789|nr:nucleoside phosphorylase [Haladaptatus sp. W1]